MTLLVTLIVIMMAGQGCSLYVNLIGNVSENTASGRVDVNINGTQMTICRIDVTDNSAKVLCHMLGYNYGHVVPLTPYGMGNAPIFLEELMCNGNEKTIADCNYTIQVTCHHRDDLALSCYDTWLDDCNVATTYNVKLVNESDQKQLIATSSNQTTHCWVIYANVPKLDNTSYGTLLKVSFNNSYDCTDSSLRIYSHAGMALRTIEKVNLCDRGDASVLLTTSSFLVHLRQSSPDVTIFSTFILPYRPTESDDGRCRTHLIHDGRSVSIKDVFLTGKYANQNKCWLLWLPPSPMNDPMYLLHISVTNITLKPSANCSQEYVELRAGVSNASRLIYKWCNSSDWNQVFIVSSPVVYLRILTDSTNWFARRIKFVFKEHTLSPSLAACRSYYLGNAIDQINLEHAYSSNESQCWRVMMEDHLASDYVLQMEVDYVSLEICQKGCFCDKLEIRDNFNIGDTFLWKICNHTDKPLGILTSQQVFYIHLNSDQTVNGKGFKLKVYLTHYGYMKPLYGCLPLPTLHTEPTTQYYFRKKPTYLIERRLCYIIGDPSIEADTYVQTEFLYVRISSRNTQSKSTICNNIMSVGTGKDLTKKHLAKQCTKVYNIDKKLTSCGSPFMYMKLMQKYSYYYSTFNWYELNMTYTSVSKQSARINGDCGFIHSASGIALMFFLSLGATIICFCCLFKMRKTKKTVTSRSLQYASDNQGNDVNTDTPTTGFDAVNASLSHPHDLSGPPPSYLEADNDLPSYDDAMRMSNI